jgi:hypothetical protein
VYTLPFGNAYEVPPHCRHALISSQSSNEPGIFAQSRR